MQIGERWKGVNAKFSMVFLYDRL